MYRRRENGKTVSVKGLNLDNRWVVPYNPYLTLKYNAHINVEICTTVMAVKYLYKYVYKVHDKSLLEIKNEFDEIIKYVDGRYLSASESCWRIFGYSMHNEFPSITRLAIHLPGEQIAYFNDNQDLNKVQNKMIATTLTAWFEKNKTDIEARNILYPDFPKHYIWNKSKKQWVKRKNKIFDTIGRVYMAHPSQGKNFT